MKGHQLLKQRVEFLYPLRLIKNKHFTKRDVARIKDNIATTTTMIRLISAALMFLFSSLMMVMMGAATKWNQVAVYGVGSLVAQIAGMSGSFICLSLLIASFFQKKDNVALILNRIAAYAIFLGVGLQMMFGIFADAQMGFTTKQETLSGSIIFLAVLIVLQPAYWLDSFILDTGTTITTIFLAIYCGIVFEMKCVYYYVVIALVFPLCSYFISTLLFYAECQHYKDTLENERLTNKAYYDNLTLCKNRHALQAFISENVPVWENDPNLKLLVILFDIDNFKEYNDTFSHLGGDYCIKTICDEVRKAFPAPSLDFYRYGGEEFLLFFELDQDKDAPKVMEKLRQAIEERGIEAPIEAPKDVVTISVGGTLIKDARGFSFEQVLEGVDKYLYQVKRNGKNACCLDGKII